MGERGVRPVRQTGAGWRVGGVTGWRVGGLAGWRVGGEESWRVAHFGEAAHGIRGGENSRREYSDCAGADIGKREKIAMDNDQKQINDREWANKDNWSGGPCGLYFSKRDTRTWVPKSRPGFGWTPNIGKPAGAIWLFCVLLAPFFVTLGLLAVAGG